MNYFMIRFNDHALHGRHGCGRRDRLSLRALLLQVSKRGRGLRGRHACVMRDRVRCDHHDPHVRLRHGHRGCGRRGHGDAYHVREYLSPMTVRCPRPTLRISRCGRGDGIAIPARDHSEQHR